MEPPGWITAVAPAGRTMGHAGAIVSSSGESAPEKSQLLEAAGLVMAPDPASLGSTVARVLAERGLMHGSSALRGI